MFTRNKIIFLLAVITAALALLVSCGGSNKKDFDLVILHFYDDAKEVDETAFRLPKGEMSEAIAERVARNYGELYGYGYRIIGYYAKVDGAEKVHLENTSKEEIDELLKKAKPDSDGWKHINLYPVFDTLEYSLEYFFAVWNESERTKELIYRDGDKAQSTVATVDHFPRAPGGYNATGDREIVGWKYITNRQNNEYKQIIDFAGNLMIPTEKASTLVSINNNLPMDHKDYEMLVLYPIFGELFSIITLDYGTDEFNTEYYKLDNGGYLESLELPTPAYSSLGVFVGWSLEKDTFVPAEGQIWDEDTTLYAYWVPAKRVNVYAEGESDPFTLYITNNGKVMGDMPTELYKYSIDKWYRDKDHTMPMQPSYSGCIQDGNYYVTLKQTKKEITLNPKNGDAPYTVYVTVDSESFDLPEWHGYVIEGWYTDSSYTGSPVELDFGSVTDGATYYAKWTKTN